MVPHFGAFLPNFSEMDCLFFKMANGYPSISHYLQKTFGFQCAIKEQISSFLLSSEDVSQGWKKKLGNRRFRFNVV